MGVPRPDVKAGAHRGCHGCLVVARVSSRVKAPRFGTDDGDTRWCRYPLEDDVVVLLSVSKFRVKTLV